MKRLTQLMIGVAAVAVSACDVKPQATSPGRPVAKKADSPRPLIDGQLNSSEWPSGSTVLKRYAYGWFLIRVDQDNLYIGLDVSADDVDDGVWTSGIRGDLFEVFVDINGDGVLNVNDVTYRSKPGQPRGAARLRGTFVRVGDEKLEATDARVAVGFAPTARNPTAHRIWELSIPIKELTGGTAASIGLAARVSSSQPPLNEQGPRPDAMLILGVVRGSTVALQLPAGQPVPAVASAGGGISRAILPDGTVEVTFPDSVKKRYYVGRTETIWPDGRRSSAIAISAPRPSPPALPSETAVRNWIDLEASDLLDTIKTLLRGDDASIGNYLASEQGLTIYQKVDKRIRCIFYLTTPQR